MNDFPLVEVAAGIISRGNKFLAAKRPSGKPMAGYWEFPGGKLREAESPFDALCRELEEELGIKTISGDYLFCREHLYEREGFAVRLHFFLIQDFAGDPVAREGQEIAWLDPEMADRMAFLPADREILAKLKDFTGSGTRIPGVGAH